MLPSAVRGLFRRSSSPQLGTTLEALAPIATAPKSKVAAVPDEPIVSLPWPAARLQLTNQLWGPGYISPGGEIETQRLTRPMGLSAAVSVLIVGVGSGGPASVITRNTGAWVTGMDTDPSLVAAARALVKKAQLTKKVTIGAWDPANPVFDSKTHHHCLALEPFQGAPAEPIVDGLARALKTGGQIVITELTADTPLSAADPAVRRWAELEHRDPANLLAPVAVTRMLGRVGLDVRVAEDMSQSHLEHAMLGWRVLLRELDTKPSRQEAVHLVREAELWLLRRRLIKEGRLRLMRWHAMEPRAGCVARGDGRAPKAGAPDDFAPSQCSKLSVWRCRQRLSARRTYDGEVRGRRLECIDLSFTRAARDVSDPPSVDMIRP